MTWRSFSAGWLAFWLAGAQSFAAAAGNDWLDGWATPLTEEEMAQERGGLRGLSFAIQFEGLVNGVEGAGIINLLDPAMGLADGLPSSVDNPGATEVLGFLGEIGPFQGIGQFAIVNGNGNEVVNNLTVNIYIMDAAGSLSTFTDVLSASR